MSLVELKKRIQEEILDSRPHFGSENYFQFITLEKVLNWIDELEKEKPCGCKEREGCYDCCKGLHTENETGTVWSGRSEKEIRERIKKVDKMFEKEFDKTEDGSELSQDGLIAACRREELDWILSGPEKKEVCPSHFEGHHCILSFPHDCEHEDKTHWWDCSASLPSDLIKKSLWDDEKVLRDIYGDKNVDAFFPQFRKKVSSAPKDNSILKRAENMKNIIDGPEGAWGYPMPKNVPVWTCGKCDKIFTAEELIAHNDACHAKESHYASTPKVFIGKGETKEEKINDGVEQIVDHIFGAPKEKCDIAHPHYSDLECSLPKSHLGAHLHVKKEVSREEKPVGIEWHHGTCDSCEKKHVVVAHYNYLNQATEPNYRLCKGCLRLGSFSVNDLERSFCCGQCGNLFFSRDAVEEHGKDGSCSSLKPARFTIPEIKMVMVKIGFAPSDINSLERELDKKGGN